MAEVVLRGVTKRYGEVTAVDRLDLAVDDGELLVVLGPSGCGKTTALRLVAGLEDLDEGAITIGGRVVNDVEPKDRDVAMVFQSYALYPHLSVARNIEFPLRRRGVPAGERRTRVAAVAGSLGLGELLDRKPGQLSGGQRQRVALARAIVRAPAVFLMDEPLSNLDAALRQQTRADIVALQRRLGTTTLYVTHDQVEAMTMGHRIAVMDGGALQQVDRPEHLYARPATVFVASFMGTPGMNLVPGELAATGDAVTVAGGALPLAPQTAPPGRAVIAGVRPEHLSLAPAGPLRGTVRLVELLGAEVHVVTELADGSTVIVRQASSSARPEVADAVTMAAVAGSVHLFDPGSGARLEPAR